MKVTKGIKETVPYAVIAALMILNGPGTAQALYRMTKEGMHRRNKKNARNDLQKTAFRTVLTRLKDQGLVANPSRGVWQATKKAIGIYATVRGKEKSYEKFVAEHGKKRDTIVIFDVPKKKGSLRHRLRAELVELGYELLQKSVWIGGGPLPEGFMNFLKSADLLATVHIFRIEKRGTVT